MECQLQINRMERVTSEERKLLFTIKYNSNRYLEILNIKSYSEETLLGQVGGYIGKLIDIQFFERTMKLIKMRKLLL